MNKNKRHKIEATIFLLIAILLAPIINHLIYGNSNSTISQFEIIDYQIKEAKKRSEVKELADYIYSRIEVYKIFDNKTYLRTLLLHHVYNYGTIDQIKERLK